MFLYVDPEKYDLMSSGQDNLWKLTAKDISVSIIRYFPLCHILYDTNNIFFPPFLF